MADKTTFDTERGHSGENHQHVAEKIQSSVGRGCAQKSRTTQSPKAGGVPFVVASKIGNVKLSDGKAVKADGQLAGSPLKFSMQSQCCFLRMAPTSSSTRLRLSTGVWTRSAIWRRSDTRRPGL